MGKQNLLLLAVCAILGTIVYTISTPFGVGISPDSHAYFEGAEDLIAGMDLDLYGAHYAPFYSVLVALISLFGLSLMASASLLNIASLVLGGFFLAKSVDIITRGRTKKYILISIAAAFVMHWSIISIYNVALSDGLFLSLLIICTYCYQKYKANGAISYLILTVILLILLVLTRYVGAFLLAPLALHEIWNKDNRTLQHFVKLGTAALIVLLPAILWIYFKSSSTTYFVESERSFNSLNISHLKMMISSFMLFLVPPVFGFWVRIILSLTMVIISFYFISKIKISGLIKDSFLYFSIPIFYMISIILSMVILSPNILPFERYMVMIVPFLLVFLLVHLGEVRKVPYAGVVIVFLVMSAFQLNTFHETGAGTLTREWQESELKDYAERISDSTLIFSNKHEQMQLALNRNIEELPKMKTQGKRVNTSYDTEIISVIEQLKANNGMLIIFKTLSDDELESHNIDYWVSHEDLRVEKNFKDGFVLVTL